MKRLTLSAAFLLTVLIAGCYTGSRPPHVGAAAKEFSVQDSDHQVSLNQFRGQVVILNFWATWCPPCDQELPSLMDMQNRMRALGVVVVGVSIDVDGDAYHRYLKQRNVNFVTVRDPEQKVAGDVRHLRLAGKLHHRSPGSPAPEDRGTHQLGVAGSHAVPEQAIVFYVGTAVVGCPASEARQPG